MRDNKVTGDTARSQLGVVYRYRSDSHKTKEQNIIDLNGPYYAFLKGLHVPKGVTHTMHSQTHAGERGSRTSVHILFTKG